MRIYVGGLTYATTTDDLRTLFASAGNVTDANVVQDKYSGQSKGFGFVDMPDADEARAAIARFNGHSLGGRSLTVNEAKPREERGGYGGGGRSSYGGGGSRW